MSDEKSFPYRGWGVALLVALLLLNPWVLGWLLTNDGTIDNRIARMGIWLFDLVLLVTGIHLCLRRKPLDGRRLAFQAVLLMFFVLMAEGLLRVVDRVLARGPEPELPREARAAYAGADWATELFDDLDELTIRQRRFTYHPHLAWDALWFESRYVNVDADGVRKSWQPPIAEGQTVPTLYVFGGSTIWGMGSRDDHTIPSHLARVLHERGHTMNVVNYGDIAHTFTQGLFNLILLLKQGHRPDYVIFYDGVNDTYAAYQSGRAGDVIDCFGLPAKFHARPSALEQFLTGAQGLLSQHVMLYRYAAKLGSGQPPANPFPEVGARMEDADLQSLAEEIAAYYAGSQALLEPLSREYGFRYYTFWQPVIFTEDKMFEGERIDIRTGDERLAKVHHHLLDLLRKWELKNFLDVSDVLHGRPGPYYYDYCHLSEEGNRVVATRVADELVARVLARNTE